VSRDAAMFCRMCGAEFGADIDRCPLCGVVPMPSAPPDSRRGVFADEAVVTAAEVWNPVEAEIVCSLLRGYDIPCILKAENQYAVDATYTIGPLARRRILVRKGDLARAREILQAVPLLGSPPET
jgi:hypothetical protein